MHGMCESDPNITTHHLNFLPLAGDDYIATTVVLTFMSGDMEGETRNVNIPIVDDILVENTEVFDVELLVPGTAPPAATATIAIFDNDGKL